MPAAIPRSTLAIDAGGASNGPPPPDPGFLESIAATFRTGRDDQTGHLDEERMAAYYGIVEALGDRGYNIETMVPFSRTNYFVNEDAIWQAIAAERAKDAKALPGVPVTQAEFESQWRQQLAERQAKDADTANRSGWVPWLIGGAGAAMTDVTSYIPFGGAGGGMARKVGAEMLGNAIVEAASAPAINIERRRQGREELTLGEVGANAAFAGLAGAAIRTGIEAPRLLSDAVTANVARLPAPLRQRWEASQLAKADPLDDPVLLADLAEALVGPERLSDGERSALVVARREGRTADANPFLPTGAGVTWHDDMVQAALASMADLRPLPGRAPASGPTAAPPVPTRRAVARFAPGLGGESAEARFMAQVRSKESGGNDAARNTRSSATGRYQFTDSTWLAYYRQRFGTGGLSDAQILAKRGDGQLQDVLMRDLTQDNAAALRRIGQPVTEGNLYLAHFAGKGGAAKILRAAPDALLENVLGPKVLEANPFLRGHTAEWLVEWAHRKMGNSAPGSTPRLRDEVALDDAEAVRMQQALDDAQQRVATLADEDRRARSGEDPMADALATEPVRVDTGEDLRAFDGQPLEPLAMRGNAAAPEVLAILPDLRSIVADRSRSLNDTAALARDLGVDELQVRQALTQLALGGEIRMNVPAHQRERVKGKGKRRRWQTDEEVLAARGGSWDGAFMRTPPAPKKDLSLLEWISARGGLNDSGGDLKAMGVDRWHQNAPFRRQIIRPEGAPADKFGLDTTLTDAIEAGYFPELEGYQRNTYADLLDSQVLADAINEELAGKLRYATERKAGAQVLEADPQREAADAFRQTWAEHGNDPADLPEEWVNTAAARWLNGEGLAPEHVIATMIREEYEDTLARLVDESMDADYGVNHDVFNPDIIDEWTQRFDERRAAAYPGRDRGGDRADGPGRSGQPGEPGTAGAGDSKREAAARAAADAAEQGRRLADLPPAERAPFLDPEADAARQQADSLAHDLRAAVDPNIADLQRQQAQLGADAPMRAPTEQDGTMGLALFDAQDAPGFRFEVDGEPRTAQDLLADIEQDEAMLKSIRDCL